ncbi:MULTISPECIES: F0F1 ATP synthase subunit A [unclassified Schaalia]|uniref:F0F1 ATP synthase subunit A n=1 Tax=unclassified Schaalia TaxID=2691889 RepID=UPI001E59C2E6|nr:MULTISPECIES: F0F1 ATP synthase subunit A [unclassified Schaalia]MCD4549649.1 F0F1 ATP synthase subunit A [Schaalia sp. lx-260]MCD4556712.1 F0F1 ATP synthase subunit A [Schaalia sp. lx-100]
MLNNESVEGILSTSTVTEATPRRVYKTPVWYWVLVGILVCIMLVTAIPAFTMAPHQPSVEDFFPTPIFGGGTAFSFNRLALARIIMATLLCVVVVIVVRSRSLIPSRGQALLELAAEFIRGDIAINMLGPVRGKRFAPLLTTIFFAILLMNLSGVIPGINIAVTSVIAVPMVFAACVYITSIVAGIRAQGLGHYLRSQLMPPGVPKIMYVIISPIEFLSNFVIRPFTLTLRILCNMIAGHLILALTYFGTALLLSQVNALSSLGLLTGAAMFIMTFFEVFVAFLQAYIFTILSTVYIKLSVEAH